jgi:1-acyl-sn-glycerol-3-phosphate acyltransferase
MLQCIYSNIARGILLITGWSPIKDEIFDRLNQYEHTVLVFSHTSYVDFYVLALYLMAYPKELAAVRTLVKPQPFQYAGWLLRKFGAIPSTHVDEKNGGAVDRIVQTLQQSPRFIFLISPKGSIVKREWRSGYYHIANKLDSHVRVAGLDYEKMAVVVSDDIEASKSEDEVRDFCRSRLENIVPLFPEQEIVPIRPHTHRRVVNYKYIIGVSVIMFGYFSL